MYPHTFEADGLSLAGARPTNDDRCLILKHPQGFLLAAVADGVSSLAASASASTLAVQALESWWNGCDWNRMPSIDALLEGLVLCMQWTNTTILLQNRKKGLQGGTTLSVLLLYKSDYRVAHIGDSRIYHIDGGGLGRVEQLTEDHTTVVPRQIGSKTVMKQYLTKCLGFQEEFDCQRHGGIHHGKDAYLVCSDGVYNTLSHQQIKKTVRQKRRAPLEAAQALILLAEQQGEKDNLTAAVVRVTG